MNQKAADPRDLQIGRSNVKDNKELMSLINSIQDAEIEDGGSGAFYINLKKKL